MFGGTSGANYRRFEGIFATFRGDRPKCAADMMTRSTRQARCEGGGKGRDEACESGGGGHTYGRGSEIGRSALNMSCLSTKTVERRQRWRSCVARGVGHTLGGSKPREKTRGFHASVSVIVAAVLLVMVTGCIHATVARRASSWQCGSSRKYWSSSCGPIGSAAARHCSAGGSLVNPNACACCNRTYRTTGRDRRRWGGRAGRGEERSKGERNSPSLSNRCPLLSLISVPMCAHLTIFFHVL